MKTHHVLASLLLGVALLGSPSFVRAEDDRTAYADYLFKQGVELMKKGDCAAAVPKFLSSFRLDPAAASLMNVATCYTKDGRTGSAWRTYRKAASLAEAEHDAELQAQAAEALSKLDPTLTKLKLITTNKTDPVSLTLNGESIPIEDGMPIPLDPGDNVIEAYAPGHQPWRRTVSAGDPGVVLVVDVPELPKLQAANEGSPWRTTAIVVGAVGVAGMLTGLGFGISAKSAYDSSKSNCDQNFCNPQGYDQQQRALDHATVSTIAFGVGAVATAAGVVIWFASPEPNSRVVRVRSFVQPQGAGLSFEGTL